MSKRNNLTGAVSTVFFTVALLLCCYEFARAVQPKLSSKYEHSLALLNDGTVLGWGSDQNGQLGQGRLVLGYTPSKVQGLSAVKMLASGAYHSLALTVDGSVWAWGLNDSGQLGNGTTTNSATPTNVLGLQNIAAISAGHNHNLALAIDGTVWSWGANGEGALGDGTTTNRLSPIQVADLSHVVALAAGNPFSVALKEDGSVWAWGGNIDGRLGNGSTSSQLNPVQVSGLNGVIAITASEGHTLAVKSDGSVWAWGRNDSGQLGNCSAKMSATPVRVVGLSGAVSIVAGVGLSMLVKDDHTIWGWGSHNSGVCTLDSANPKPVTALSNVASLATRSGHTLALKLDASVWAWGANYHGELGDGTNDYRFTPVQVVGLAGTIALASGQSHSLALGSDGSVWAWGSNEYGQLGDGSQTIFTRPAPVNWIEDAIEVAAGFDHSLAIKREGSVWAWGSNIYTGLGNGTKAYHKTPILVEGLTNVQVVAAGGYYSLAAKQDGTVWAWGTNWYGQLGDGSTEDRLIPVQVLGLTDIVALTASNHSLALKKDGSVWAWGFNAFGQLGNGTTTNSMLPVQVVGIADVIAIAASGGHSLALKRDGTVWAWGLNDSGELGDGSTTSRLTPIQVPNLDGVTSLAAATDFSMVRKRDGSVWFWGSNKFATASNYGLVNIQLWPVQIAGLTDVVGIAAGRDYRHAVKSDGSVLSWGVNYFGAIGDGTLAYRRSPVLVTNTSADGPLDLLPEVPNNIPPDLIPPFWLQVSKANSVSTAITYNTEDLNRAGHVYIVAYLRPDSPLLKPSVLPTSRSTNSTQTKDTTTCPTSIAGTVPAVLTRSGWKQTTCTTPTEPLYSGTLSTSTNTFPMYDAAQFDQTKDNGLFCVSYAGSSTTSAKGLIRSVVSGVDASLKQCPPIQLGSTGDTSAPSIPLNITATAAGPGQVNLSWSAATDNVGVAHYNIYRGTSLIATVGNVTSYTDTSPQASTAYSYSVMACDIALNCSGQSTNAQTSTPAQPSVVLSPGWNLVGNGGSTAMNAATLFGDARKVYSLWKWVRSGSTPGISYPTWAMYAPGQADGGAAYAASKGYEVLTSIQSAEGFWVNAKAAMSVPMTAPAWILSSTFQPNQSNALPTGWSLIAAGEANTASSFNKAIGATPPAPGSIPSNLTTLWAWENSTSRWYFYAPSLEAQGTLQGYVRDKGYLDFGNLTLTPTAGVWVNR